MLKATINSNSAKDRLGRKIPMSVHNQLNNVFEGGKLAKTVRVMAEPIVPKRTGKLRKSATFPRLITGFQRSTHKGIIQYQAINYEQKEMYGEVGDIHEHEWNYAEKMELHHFNNYTTPGTHELYLEETLEKVKSDGVAKNMVANAVRTGVKNGGLK